MKQQFITFLNHLMEAAPQVVENEMTDEVKAFIDALVDGKSSKPILTDSGKIVLEYMKDNLQTPVFKARDIAEGLAISSRGVSGALRKLVNDGFCEKVGQDPVIYTLTEKGKNFDFINEGEND